MDEQDFQRLVLDEAAFDEAIKRFRELLAGDRD